MARSVASTSTPEAHFLAAIGIPLFAYTWSAAAAGSYGITAVARDNSGGATTSAVRTVTVSGGLANHPPTVSLTAPTNGATYIAPASIPLAATASDVDGPVGRVDFYAGSTLLGSDWTPPFAYTWSAAAAGSYGITAVARDNSGGATTSAVRTVTVSAGSGNQPPLVSLTAPGAGAIFTRACVGRDRGQRERYRRFSDTRGLLCGTGLDWVRYHCALLDVLEQRAGGPGTALTAVARDNAGAMTVSGARDIRVDSATLPRTAVFTAPANHATAVTRYFLEIFPAGANPLVANPVATRDSSASPPW